MGLKRLERFGMFVIGLEVSVVRVVRRTSRYILKLVYACYVSRFVIFIGSIRNSGETLIRRIVVGIGLGILSRCRCN